MGETGLFAHSGNHRAGPASVRLDELSFDDLLAGATLQVGPRLLESLPWRKINDFLAAVGTERSLEGLAHRVLREFSTLLPFDYGGFTIVNPRVMDQPLMVIDFRAPPGAVSEYFGHYITLDPCVPLYSSTFRGVVNWTLRDCEFTRDFALRYNTRHTMVLGNLKDRADTGFIMALHRMTRSGFNEREMAACSTVRLHLHNLFTLVYAPQKAMRSRLAAAMSACGLSMREREVVFLLCDRLSAGEIAERLKISRRTVEKHIEHVYLKLRVHTRRGLREESILAEDFGNALGNSLA